VAIKMVSSSDFEVEAYEKILPSPYTMNLRDSAHDAANELSFLVMDRLPQSLYQLERSGQKRDEGEIKQIFADILRGIENLHRSGILAVDLHSRNVMVNEGRAKLIDFGGEPWSDDYWFDDFTSFFYMLEETFSLCKVERSADAVRFIESFEDIRTSRSKCAENRGQATENSTVPKFGLPEKLWSMPWLKDVNNTP
jgi:serine/threonine protein kinase